MKNSVYMYGIAALLVLTASQALAFGGANRGPNSNNVNFYPNRSGTSGNGSGSTSGGSTNYSGSCVRTVHPGYYAADGVTCTELAGPPQQQTCQNVTDPSQCQEGPVPYPPVGFQGGSCVVSYYTYQAGVLCPSPF